VTNFFNRALIALLTHIVLGTVCRELCRTAEPIETQCGILSRVGPRNMHYMGMLIAREKGPLLGCQTD